MSLYKTVDDYFFKERGANDPPTRRQDDRARVRVPAKAVFALGKNLWLLGTHSWTNLSLMLVPLGIFVPAGDANNAMVFWSNYLALVGVFGLFRYGSEELSIPALRTFGGIWDTTVGALSLDLEIAIIALCQSHFNLVKTYIVGKIVSTTLLTLGICLIVGGFRRGEERFTAITASILTSLLATSVFAFGTLSVFWRSVNWSNETLEPLTLILSRAASIVLLALFLLYQLFRKTHSHILSAESLDAIPDSDGSAPGSNDELQSCSVDSYRAGSALRVGQLNPFIAVCVMVASAVVTYLCSLPLLDADSGRLVPGRSFIAFCLLPNLAEIAELSRLVRLVWDGRTQDALVATAGTSVQIALYIAPIICLIGWVLDEPMDLRLSGIEVTFLGVSIWIFSYITGNGKSHYIGGAMCIGLYLIQIGTFLIYPDDG